MYKKHLKRTLAITLVFAVIQINTTFAQFSEIRCTPTVNGKSVICEVEIPEIKGNGALLMIIAKGKTDIQESDVYAIELITEKNPAPLTFVMPEGAKGDENQQYSVVIKNGNDMEKTFDFQYVNPKISNQIIAALRVVERENIDVFMHGSTQGVSNIAGLKSVGVHTGVYEDITANKSLIWDIYYSNADSFAEMTDDNIIDCLNSSIICGALNEENADASKLLSLLNKSFENVKYVDMSDSKKQWINQYVSTHLPISLTNRIENVFDTANILYSFNNARYSDIDSLIINYGNKVGIMDSSYYTIYRDFKKDKKTLAQENMVIALGRAPVSNISGLVPAFEAAVLLADSSDSSDRSGGSGQAESSGGAGILSGMGSAYVTSTTNILQQSTPFTDLDTVNWAKEAIVALNNKKVISGMGDGKFCPQESVTREQMVKMILLASGFSATDTYADFKDVDTDAWYAPYVGNAVKQGIVAGIESDQFGVGLNITRQDSAVMIDRAMEIINKAKKDVREYTEFADQSEIAEYAREAIKRLYVAGVISGKGNQSFAPKAPCTRAEAAKMIYDAFVK